MRADPVLSVELANCSVDVCSVIAESTIPAANCDIWFLAELFCSRLSNDGGKSLKMLWCSISSYASRYDVHHVLFVDANFPVMRCYVRILAEP